MEYDMPYPFGAVLKRKIMDSNYWHYGVASEFYHPKTGKQMVYQFNKWLTYTNFEGEKAFVPGYPKRAASDTESKTPEVSKDQLAEEASAMWSLSLP